MITLFTCLSKSRRSELLHEVNMYDVKRVVHLKLDYLNLISADHCITWMLCSERKNNGQERLIAEIMRAIKFLATIEIRNSQNGLNWLILPLNVTSVFSQAHTRI